MESVRNCSKVDKTIVNSIIDIITGQLIAGNTRLTFRSLSDMISEDMKSHLKSQCGGLQTLVRNHRHVLDVNNGFIVFAKLKPIDDKCLKDKSIRVKTKKCWFHSNHPNGCHLSNDQCRFIYWTKDTWLKFY